MNKKGKNKKGKVPNPIPSQEEKSGDKVEKFGDKIEDVAVTSGDKKEEVGKSANVLQNLEEKVYSEKAKEERVPEIVSEIITSPVDAKDEETPKKPKRNRGKNKKGKDDDFDDYPEEKSKETDIQQPVEESQVDNPETKSKTEELPPITPTARKKKNKKKNTEHKTDDRITPDQELSNISTTTKIQEIQTQKTETIPDIKEEFLKTELSDQETKQSKKKNKKKKRNDSERSDKEEFSCTAAFQKILDEKEEPSVSKTEEKADDLTNPIDNIAPVTSKAVLEQPKEHIPILPIIEKERTPIKEEEVIETPITESKNKKKNKKDKKQTQKLEEIPKQDETKTDQISPLLDPVPPVQIDVVKQKEEVITSSEKDHNKEVAMSGSPIPLPEDFSAKSKAKIAKPVEKKRKGKHEFQTLDSKVEDIIVPMNVEKTPSPAKYTSSEIRATDAQKTCQIEPQVESATDLNFTTPDEDEKLIAQEFELLAEKAMGKKRKKASKMPKTLDVVTDTKPIEVKDENKEQLAVITEILTPQIEQQEFVIMSQKSDTPITIDTVKEFKEVTKPIQQPEFQGKILLTPENITEEKEFSQTEDKTSQQAEDIQKTESKPNKKRKKSPKPPKKTELIPEIEKRTTSPKPQKTTTESTKAEELPQQSLSGKIDASNITRMYDIEISSIKADESEGSVCDVIPDITYPRASSQQLSDDNNNTVIREIFTPETDTMRDIPSIQKRSLTSKKQEPGIAPKEEKTDLKSKMMEVNQDMEELRLSIERSLAELTSMEKTEDTIEKEFEATRNKAINVANLLFDTDESVSTKASDDKGKLIEQKDILATVVDKPLDDTKTTKTTVDIKQKSEGKLQPFTETAKSIGDRSKKTPTKELIEPPTIESKIGETQSSSDSKILETPPTTKDVIPLIHKVQGKKESVLEEPKTIESFMAPIPLPPVAEKKTEIKDDIKKDIEAAVKEQITETPTSDSPICPTRKDNKGKSKKKKGKQETQATTAAQSTPSTTQSQTTQETKKDEKKESKTDDKSESKGNNQSAKKGKQQSSNTDAAHQDDVFSDVDYEPIDNFEDALTSSIDDVNKTFEMIVKESQDQSNPKINIIAPDEEKKPLSPPKNLLGQPNIPARSNRRDFKKEKDKIPNEITARVKIKDSVEVEKKQSKNTQTINRMKEFSKEYKMNDNDDFVYKYSFRKVFLQSSCHVCKKDLSGSRVPCSYCNLLFYCSNKHKDEDWPHHQALCFAVSTIGHLKDQKHIYADAKNLTGHDYRLIRMQMIVSCEKVLKRRLVPWEQEALLYPRICAHVPCREWRQSKLSDCQGCGQISFCTDNADHFPKSHSRWCKSYSLYEKLVSYQQTKGRLEPKLPTKVLQEPQSLPEKMNEVLASMYEEKIDINDIQYAALTQLATAPLTAAYCYQLCRSKAAATTNGVHKNSSFTIHVVGAELQFEADALNKWEVFFLHLRPDLQELRVVLINYNLNPSNLPLELLGKIKLCENCCLKKRRVMFSFQDKRTYSEYKSSEDYVVPDIVCAFNPSIQRSSVYNGKDPWPSTINAILKLKIPFIITGYTITELHKDCIRIKECSETGYNFIAEPKYNNFASVRPDRNFISDDEMPLLFKNYCFAIISG